MSLADLWADVSGARLWIDATILVAIAGFVWSIAQRAGRELYFLFSLRTRVIEVEFHARSDVPTEIQSLKFLHIRYGNDTYLEKLASDAEKHHGRLRNVVKGVEVFPLPDGRRKIRVRMRVHKRLGTQFKFFVDVAGDVAEVVDYLEAHDNVYDVSPSPRPGNRKRVFFLISDYPTVKTIDGFENNMIFPV